MHRIESSRQHPELLRQLGLGQARPSSDLIGPSPFHFVVPNQLSDGVIGRYIAAEPLSGPVAPAETESWLRRGIQIGLRIFALRWTQDPLHAACWAHARHKFFREVELNSQDQAVGRSTDAWMLELFQIDAPRRFGSQWHWADSQRSGRQHGQAR
jgi:hypothetical protein